MGRMVTNPATRKMPLFLILSLWHIARLSMRKLYDERGNVYFGVDHDIRERLQAKLMMAVLTFKAEE